MTTLIIYYAIAYFIMFDVLRRPYPHDLIDVSAELPIIRAIANSGPALAVLYRLKVDFFTERLDIYAKRAALLYLLKGFIQSITVIPQPNGVSPCQNRSFAQVVLFGSNCADMMFSGHTGLTMIMLPQTKRIPVVIIIGTCLKLTRMHYTSDILVAVLIVWQIERWLPEKKTVNTIQIVNELV